MPPRWGFLGSQSFARNMPVFTELLPRRCSFQLHQFRRGDFYSRQGRVQQRDRVFLEADRVDQEERFVTRLQLVLVRLWYQLSEDDGQNLARVVGLDAEGDGADFDAANSETFELAFDKFLAAQEQAGAPGLNLLFQFDRHRLKKDAGHINGRKSQLVGGIEESHRGFIGRGDSARDDRPG